MDNYHMTYEFKVGNTVDLDKKLIFYFGFYDFNLIKKDTNFFVFNKKGSLLDTWTFNPLKWSSEITTQLVEHDKILISYSVDTSGLPYNANQMFYKSYLQNLGLYINNDTNFEMANKNLQNHARQSMMSSVFKIISGGVIGLLLGFALAKLTDIKMLPFLGLIIGSIITSNILTRPTKMKNAI